MSLTPRMEPAKAFPIAMEPAAAAAPPEQGEAPWRRRARSALPVIVLLAAPAGFAGLAYRTRHSRHDLGFLYTTAYFLTGLLSLLCRSLEKLELVPSLNDDGPAGADGQQRRVRLVVWLVSAALGNTLALLIADAMPSLALKLAVWGLTAGGTAVAFYFTFCHARSDTDHPRHHELSPEKV